MRRCDGVTGDLMPYRVGKIFIQDVSLHVDELVPNLFSGDG